MTKMRQRLIVMVAAALGCSAGAALAQPFPGGLPACLAELNTCHAGLGTCTTTLDVRSTDLGTCTTTLDVRSADLGACATDLNTCRATLADAQQSAGLCLADLNACGANLEACTTDLSTCHATPAAATTFSASGQTSCWNGSGVVIPCAGTGQDGDTQAGAPLSYTDNGDGTITDHNTKLVWEKKSSDGSIHDVNAGYAWANAFAVHIAGLNAANFAGHDDWRLPNVRELQSIANYENFNPSVSSEFNTACMPGATTVLTGSCTTAAQYWASSTSARAPTFAWAVIFSDGLVGEFSKAFVFRVRAVRGGL